VIPNGKKRILVIDDQPMVADALKLVLKMDGYEVETAETWRQALELFKPGKFAIVFTDYIMPGMNGAQLASIIKSQDPSQPIILVTAYSDLAGAGASSNVDMVIEKPWSVDELRAAIRKISPEAP
jgi:DNA-binding NtrC family response regulator